MNPAQNQPILLRYATLAGAHLIAGAFGFLVAALLARNFGPAGFGAIALATSITSYALVATVLGTDFYAVRAVAARQASLEQMIPIVIFIRFLLSTIVFLLIALGTCLLPKLQESRVLIGLFSLTFFTDAILLIWVPQALHRTNTVAVCNALLQLINFLSLYCFLLVSSSIYMAPAAKIFADILVACGLMLSIRGYTGRLHRLPDLAGIRSIVRDCAPLGVTQLIRGIALASDLIILGLVSNLADTGVYAAAHKLYFFLLSLGGAYFVILVPRLAAISASGGSLQREVRASLIRVLPVLTAALALVWAGSDMLVKLLFGDVYADAAGILRVLALAAFAGVIFGHHRNLLLVKRRQGVVLRLTIASSALHICLKAILIPIVGILGCALGTLIGEVFLVIALWLAARRSDAVSCRDTPKGG